MRIGLVSDTHGLLRPELFDALKGVDHILHAGDIGPAELIPELEAIAPLTAVWGNTDGWDVRERVPEVARVELGGVTAVVLHGHQMGSPKPETAAAEYPDADLVVFGHSHQPAIRRIGEIWAVNPGSAGPRRFGLPVTVAVAETAGQEIRVELVELIDSPTNGRG